MQTAMAQMTASAAGVRTVNRMAVGVGALNGKTAVSGFSRAKSYAFAPRLAMAFRMERRANYERRETRGRESFSAKNAKITKTDRNVGRPCTGGETDAGGKPNCESRE